MEFTILLYMNKFFLFLAFAAFALVACSDNSKPPPSREELCKAPIITKECLVGKWTLEEVKGDTEKDCEGGNLELYEDGSFTFSNSKRTSIGAWKLNEGGTMKIDCESEDYHISVGITVVYPKLEVNSENNKASFSQCPLSKPITGEVFSASN